MREGVGGGLPTDPARWAASLSQGTFARERQRGRETESSQAQVGLLPREQGFRAQHASWGRVCTGKTKRLLGAQVVPARGPAAHGTCLYVLALWHAMNCVGSLVRRLSFLLKRLKKTSSKGLTGADPRGGGCSN